MDTDVGLVYNVRVKYSPTEWDTTATECPSGKLAYFPQETDKRKSQKGGGGVEGRERDRQTDRDRHRDRERERQRHNDRDRAQRQINKQIEGKRD